MSSPERPWERRSSSGTPTLIEAKGPAFPVRSYVLKLPSSQRLTVNGVNVTENRNAVLNTTLVPASQTSNKTFGVVLVGDTSYSMNGAPLAAALAAEQAFAAQRNAKEQLGLIDFNHTTKVVLPLTNSASAISQRADQDPQGRHGHVHLRRGRESRGDAQGRQHQLRLDRRPL